jgi:ATP-binding cassette subfamily F protein 3
LSLVVASALTLAHGDRVLFDEEGFSVGPRDRVGLVGANGTGKSTLLKILAGALAPDSGTLTWRRGARAGYLPQDVAELPDLPVLDAVLASVPGRAALEERILSVEAALGAARAEEDQLELSAALASLHDDLSHFEERHGRHRAERILGGLGFREADLGRPARVLSGGWKMRAALAGLLLQDPDLLLLDEPTNHLDVPTLTWFDAFLRGTPRAVVLVTHDRDFLNRQVDRILSLEPEGLRGWAGDYDDYVRQRAEEEERLSAAAARQEARRAELTRFIERFGAKATKAAQARSKQKLLDRMEHIETLAQRATVRFRFHEAPRSGKEVLRLVGLSKAFGPTVVYRGLDASIQRGERVAVIGPNGAGKSTLLKIVAGELAPDRGAVKLGHGVVPAYYAQHLFEKGEHGEGSAFGALDPSRSVLDTLWDLVPDRGEAYVRSIAGSFLFSGDDVDKKVGVLSGGERSRVALARILLVPANLLVLDEPTNHLDVASAEALIRALSAFEGTLLFVSHNRSFANQLATACWEVKDGGILPFPGNLDDWLYHQAQLAGGGNGGSQGLVRDDVRAVGPGNEKERKRLEAEARNARYRLEKPLRDEIARLEARIAELEGKEREASVALADPALYQDFARAKPFMDSHRAAREELAGLYQRWERAQEELAEVAPGSGEAS